MSLSLSILALLGIGVFIALNCSTARKGRPSNWSIIAPARTHTQGVRFGKPCLEFYETDPDQVANQQELVTSIFLPLRGA